MPPLDLNPEPEQPPEPPQLAVVIHPPQWRQQQPAAAPPWAPQQPAAEPPVERPAAPPLPAATLSGDAGTYVTWADLKTAVHGRETEVLDALGIPWRDSSGGRHIRCPYHDHPDADPSWRWNEQTARALCTCIGRNRAEKCRSHSIFDVVALVKGLDFETAKIFVARAIGRDDLIKTKGRAGTGSTAKALLNPPESQRHDDLVVAYLGTRLKVPPDQVVMPSTRAVGWRALGYFDGELKPIGTYPAGVFEQVDRSGKVHAHRLYFAWGGLGKASLPPDAKGKPRDPKKSATKAEGENTAGRCVVFGDAGMADTCVLAEGIETAAACAASFREEIASGVVTVMAAVSTAGMGGYAPWLATRRLIIAADRDEVPPATRAGEIAARKLATRLASTLEHVAIAMPGEPGTKTDWLDEFTLRGGAAVRDALLSAPLFEPAMEEVEQSRFDTLSCLARNTEGDLRPVMRNAEILLRVQLGDGIGFDTFKGIPTFRGKAPWNDEKCECEIDETFALRATSLLQAQDLFVRPNVTYEALLSLALSNQYNSAQRWRDGLVWDGVPRLDEWLIEYLGVDEFGERQQQIDDDHNSLTDEQLKNANMHSQFVRTVGAQFFIRMIARIDKPGCKADEVLNIVGEQGLSKSMVLAIIGRVGGPWFSDHFPEIGSKDGALQMKGMLLIEFADNDRTQRTDVDRLKAFLSSQIDRFRAPYERGAKDHPRVTCFAITTNNDESLRDSTGSRRFPTVTSQWAKPDELRAVVEQLWAEASDRYDRGEQWWLTGDLAEFAKGVALRHVHEDSWASDITSWAEANPNKAAQGESIASLLGEALGIQDRTKRDRRAEMRLSTVLKKLGWIKRHSRRGSIWSAGSHTEAGGG